MDTEVVNKLTAESLEILNSRGGAWGTFDDFVGQYNEVHDKFRVFFKDIEQMKIYSKYRIRNFIEEMLCLKITRGLYVVRTAQAIDYENPHLKDCALDFLNYCKLCETQFAIELRYETLKADAEFLTFFDKIMRYEVFGEGRDDVSGGSNEN